MDNFSFIFGGFNSDVVRKCDFYLSHYKKWNNNGYYCWYSLYALPTITKKDSWINLGLIWISEPHPSSNSIIVMTKSPDSRIDDTDILCRTMGYETPFTSIPPRFMSLIDWNTAKQLFVLLSPPQRKCFADALRLCTNDEDYERGRKERSLPSGMLKQYKTWSDAEKVMHINRYLFSEIDYSELPKY